MRLPPIQSSCWILPIWFFTKSSFLSSQRSTTHIQVPKSSYTLPIRGKSIMAGPRERSRHRGVESQNTYELQDIQTSHRNWTDGGSTTQSEDSHNDRDHGHPQNPGAQLLDRRLLRMLKQRLAGVLGTCIARSAEVLRTGMGGFSKHRIMTLFMAIIICILLFLAFRGLDSSAEPFDYWFDRSTRRAMGHYPSTTTVTHSSTVYRTISVHYKQFYDARPVHHQVPIAVHPNHETKGQGKRQDLSHSHIVTRTSTSVSGLYFMPMPITNGDWPQTQQDTHPSSHLASNAKASQFLQESPSLGDSEPEAKFLLQSREIHAPRNLSADQADADTSLFTRWRVAVLYDLRRRSRSSLHLYKGWCIKNTCSPHKQLRSMCNTNKTSYDSFRKQECEWCWPENQRKHLEIEKHCTEVSKHASNAMFIICGIFLFFTLVAAILIATRMLRRGRVAKADRFINKNRTTCSPLEEKSNHVPSNQSFHSDSKLGRSTKAAKSGIEKKVPWYKPILTTSKKRSGINPQDSASGRPELQKQRTKCLGQEPAIGNSDSRERVPVLPPATPAISSRVSSELQNTSQGILLSGAGTNSSQHETQGMPRRSSRQSRAVSSGSEQHSFGIMHRRDAGPNYYNLHRLTERS